MTSPSKIAVFVHMCWLRAKPGNSLLMEREQKPAKKGGKEAVGEERKRRTGRGWGWGAAQLELGWLPGI